MMLTGSTRRKDFFECLTYFMVDAGKDTTELALELALNDSDMVRMCLCFKAEGVFDLKNLSVVTYVKIEVGLGYTMRARNVTLTRFGWRGC